MTIRFGVSPIAWINDDMPELGGNTPLDSVLKDIQDIGFSGVELGGKFPRNPAALKVLLGRFALDLVGGWYSAELLTRPAEAEIEALKPHLALLKAMGSTVFIQAETSNAIHGTRNTPLSKTPQLTDDAWKQFGARLTQVADFIQGEGLRFAYHHHLGTVVERAVDLDAFLRVTGANVGLTLDTGHAALGGIKGFDVLRAHPERIAHVHCKDVRRRVFADIQTSGHSFLDGVLAGMFTVPGDGDLDFAAVMRSLADTHYSGWVIVEAEQDPAIANPKTYGELGFKTLYREAVAAGLSVVK